MCNNVHQLTQWNGKPCAWEVEKVVQITFKVATAYLSKSKLNITCSSLKDYYISVGGEPQQHVTMNSIVDIDYPYNILVLVKSSYS